MGASLTLRTQKKIWPVKNIFGIAISQHSVLKKIGQSRIESDHLQTCLEPDHLQDHPRLVQDHIGPVSFRTRSGLNHGLWHGFELFLSNLVRLIRTVLTRRPKRPVNRKILDRTEPDRPVYITLSQHTKKVISIYHLPYRKVKFVSVPNRIWERDMLTTNLKSKRLE